MRLAFIGIGQVGAPLADHLQRLGHICSDLASTWWWWPGRRWRWSWRGKMLVDCTNPVGPDLSHGLASARSGSAVIQAQVPGCRVVKAFTIYGFENFEDIPYPAYNVIPVMLDCGHDGDATAAVAPLIRALGWNPWMWAGWSRRSTWST